MILTEKLKKILFGDPWGAVFPPKPNPPPLSYDGRTAALRVLREYVTNLTFYRAMGPGRPPSAFQIKPENFLIEWPDSVVSMVTPSIVVIPGPNADYGTIGLTSYIEEESADVYGPNTVLQWQMEYKEVFNLEIWASSKAERRGILAGLETAMTPTEQMAGIRFRMTEYYDQPVCFSIMRRRLGDEDESARNRRKAQIEFDMRFTVVALVNSVPMQPQILVDTDVEDDGITTFTVEETADPEGPI